MKAKIRILVYGTEQECRAVAELLRNAQALQTCMQEHEFIEDLETAEQKLVDWEPSLTVVLADGAEGMECVYRFRKRRPCIPVFWFSDDPNFGMLSYRLECAYFSTKPVNADKIAHALQRCRHTGIRYLCE